MRTYNINYGEVHAETARLANRIASEVVRKAESGYGQILGILQSSADGAANAALMGAVDAHRRKTLAAAELVTKMLKFIKDAAHEMERTDNRIARAMDARALHTRHGGTAT